MLAELPIHLPQFNPLWFDQTYAAAKRRLWELSLKDFIVAAWPTIEPGETFIDGPHIDAICEHLEAVTEGRIRNLLINIPPRFMKSLITCVFWPCWVWTQRPGFKWIFSSYSESLALDMSAKRRRLIESEWYQENWGWRTINGQRVPWVKLRRHPNKESLFETVHNGQSLAVSAGGPVTGKGGDCVVCDDPHNVMDAFYPNELEKRCNWYDEVFSSRLNNRQTGTKVIIMQRIAERDLSAHVLKKGTWDHLCLPMRFVPEMARATSIGWKDWRTQQGELLWPQRMDEEGLKTLEIDLGRYGVAGQLQQTPTPRGGGMFERHWFKIVPAAPAEGTSVRYWDRASSKGENDWTVGVKMLRCPKKQYYILDVVRLRGTPLEVEKAIVNTASQDGLGTAQVLEQDPGQAGVAEVGYLIRQLAGYNVRKVKVDKNKTHRAIPVAAQAQAGNVILVAGAWNEPFLDVVTRFRANIADQQDDDVDGMSGAFNELNAATQILFA